MPKVRNEAIDGPTENEIVRLISEAVRRAVAMGIMELRTIPRDDPRTAVRDVADRLRKAGVAISVAETLDTGTRVTPDKLAKLLRAMIAALEASPVPEYEWKGTARVLEGAQLASLLNISASSLKRYESGNRGTPDPIAARLHFLALLTGDLAGSYNDVGVRRWFARKRTLLNGRAPAQLLVDEWDPEDPGAVSVRQLAQELTFQSAT